jgi:hypothetical protein
LFLRISSHPVSWGQTKCVYIIFSWTCENIISNLYNCKHNFFAIPQNCAKEPIAQNYNVISQNRNGDYEIHSTESSFDSSIFPVETAIRNSSSLSAYLFYIHAASFPSLDHFFLIFRGYSLLSLLISRISNSLLFTVLWENINNENVIFSTLLIHSSICLPQVSHIRS